ncbi:MAG: hypothetical protein JO362_02160 [Streptomycetaceae bacterium]|nr:hypothetical protein [Streptomycetaceae bacterium]
MSPPPPSSHPASGKRPYGSVQLAGPVTPMAPMTATRVSWRLPSGVWFGPQVPIPPLSIEGLRGDWQLRA